MRKYNRSPDGYITQREVADILGIKRLRVQGWSYNGTCPNSKFSPGPIDILCGIIKKQHGKMQYVFYNKRQVLAFKRRYYRVSPNIWCTHDSEWPFWFLYRNIWDYTLDILIEESEVSVRLANQCANRNIKTIRDLAQIPQSELINYKNFGRKTLKEVRDFLAEYSLWSGMDKDELKHMILEVRHIFGKHHIDRQL